MRLKELIGDRWPEKKDIAVHPSTVIQANLKDAFNRGYNQALSDLESIEVDVPSCVTPNVQE